MSAIGVIWILVEIAGLIDALRHSGPDWSYAGRNRSLWLIFMFFFGPLVLPYLFAVRSRFPSRAARDEMTPFLKQ